mmetsp:Transcript_44851/g.73047  ORF Transcript_44851/g.73047 Transcript_44851/m.73047 type:complete len:397 (-) Transcript_44851:325-1515(-)
MPVDKYSPDDRSCTKGLAMIPLMEANFVSGEMPLFSPSKRFKAADDFMDFEIPFLSFDIPLSETTPESVGIPLCPPRLVSPSSPTSDDFSVSDEVAHSPLSCSTEVGTESNDLEFPIARPEEPLDNSEAFVWRGGFQAKSFSVSSRIQLPSSSKELETLRELAQRRMLFARASVVFSDNLLEPDPALVTQLVGADRPALASIPPKRGRDASGMRPASLPHTAVRFSSPNVFSVVIDHLYLTVLSRQFSSRLFRIKIWFENQDGMNMGVSGFSRPIDSKSNPKDAKNIVKPMIPIKISYSPPMSSGAAHLVSRHKIEVVAPPEPKMSKSSSVMSPPSSNVSQGLATVKSIYEGGDQELRLAIRAYFLEELLGSTPTTFSFPSECEPCDLDINSLLAV